MYRLLIAAATIVFLFAVKLNAQEKDIVFEQITNESGRSLGFITGIVQDENGFLWFATGSGLYRYNGYSYRLFKNNRNDSLSLPFNSISSLYIDNQQNLWLGRGEKLAVFNNEKRSYKFAELIDQTFELDVDVVQDKKGNYWIGPTGEGILQFNPERNQTTYYTCPIKSYSQHCWKYLDSLFINGIEIAKIQDPGNDMDTLVSVEIKNEGYFLIASSGEIDTRGIYDFGTLKQNDKIIWKLSAEKSMWVGGSEKNRFQAEPLFLKKGTYQLGFKSDMSHGCGNWEGEAPDKINYCGVVLKEISKDAFLKIQANLLQPNTDSTYIDSKDVKDMLVDNVGNFWFLSDKGIHKYNYKKNQFDMFPIDYAGLLGRDIELEYLNLYQDKSGIFWISSNNGLIKYDNIWSKFEVYQNTEKREWLTSNTIFSMFEDNHHRLWIGTDNGITIFNKLKNTVQKIKANNQNRLYNNRIYKIFEDKGGNIWVATAEGLNRLIKDPFNYTNLDLGADNSFPVVYDNDSSMWIAWGNKIIRYNRSTSTRKDYVLPDKLFPKNVFDGERDYIISDMVRSNDKNLWLAIDNKICLYNVNESKVEFIKEVGGLIVGNDSLKNSIKTLIIGKSNQLYLFCPNGIYELNQTNRKLQAFYSFNQTYDFIEDVDLGFFKSVLVDKKSNFWLRTSFGIYQFNSTLKKLELIYEFDDMVKGGELSKGGMDVDKFGNIWFATLPSIHTINGESLKHQSYICTMDHDEWGSANIKPGKDKLWIYSTTGLFSFEPEDSLFQYYSTDNGLIMNNINGLEEDNNGNIWLTTIKGLSKLDIKEEKTKNFFTDADFTKHTFLGNPEEFKTNSNEFIFFTRNGFVSFHPDSINTNIPKIVIDKFTIRGKEIDLDSLIYYKKNIHLKYNQNFIGFEFAVLDYTDPALNKYKFKLEGLDEDWNLRDADDRKASYSGLAPGSYIFKVTGSNNDKVWNPEGVSISVTISPPWYKTNFAYIIYAVLIFASVWLFIRIREKNLKEEKRILEQKVKERTAKIESQKEEIEEQHKNIKDSIHYAQRIQSAILPPVEQISEVVEDYFILYRPRDIVSGDYYWVTRRDDITIIVAADCTGHGVPGAFMSMLGVAFLNEIVNKEGIIQPNLILDRLREQIIKQLHQTGKEGESKDGMDISLYVIDHANMKLRFSGAYNPLYVIRNDDVIQLKADRMPIGYHIKMDTAFAMEEIDLCKGDCLYNSSDGYPDQFGGDDGRKFMSKNFRDLLLSIHKKPMAEQREILDKNFDEWRGSIDQIDDVVVVGVRI